MSKDIAIIGMAGRFPDASDIDAFYHNLLQNKDSVKEITNSRIQDTALSQDAKFMRIGYLENIDKFDYSLYNISPAEAATMDPAQRLLLEVVYETMNNAGYNPDHFKHSNTSVFLSEASSEYYLHADEFVDTLVTGTAKMFHAARIAREFDLAGNALMVDTACSSSLVTLHLACNELMLGDAEQALVCGTNLYLFPYLNNVLELDLWSPDGGSRAFSDKAEGMSRGEVAVAVLLKPLEQALEDKDIIHAVIKSTAVNQNAGRSSSLTAPDSKSQSDVIMHAWKKAGIDPLRIGYIEAHGSGTQLGDSLEVEGLNMAFSAYTDQKGICPISTVKNNIGHGMAAAGLTGLIKSVLTLKHGVIFPTVNFDRPNPIIDFANSAVYVNEKLTKWDEDKIYVGVTSLGASGTNAHVVLEKAPFLAQEEPDAGMSYLINISAKSNEALRDNVRALYDFFRETNDTLALRDVSYTLNKGRKHYAKRFSIIANSVTDCEQQLAEALQADQCFQKQDASIKKLIFVFSNNRVPALFVDRLAQQYSVFSEYYELCLDLTDDKANPNVISFAAQFALYKLFEKAGITTPHILGIGIGKLTTAVLSGKITLKEGVQSALRFETEAIAELEARASALISRETKDGKVAFVEMGPTGVLSAALLQVGNANKDDFDVLCMPDLPESEELLIKVCRQLYLGNFEGLKWDAFCDFIGGLKIELPAYQFQKIRCWLRNEAKIEIVDPKMMLMHGTQAASKEASKSLVLPEGTYVTQKVAKVWCETLELSTLSYEDNFFEIGGDSFKSTQVINDLNREFDIKLSFEDMFDFPTVHQLCAYINELLSVEQKVLIIWKEVLKSTDINSSDNFFELGGHSLMANQILIRLKREFHIDINFEDIFQYQTVTELAQYIQNQVPNQFAETRSTEIERVPVQEHYDLSYAQKRIWALSQFEEGSLAYLTTDAYVLEGKLDVTAFAQALQALVERHESLRTVFKVVKGEPRQVILPIEEINFELKQIDASSAYDPQHEVDHLLKQESVTAFDLSREALFRALLIRTAQERYVLMYTIHHIVSDGWSIGVLFNDLLVLYRAFVAGTGSSLQALEIQYKDYAAWESRRFESEELKIQQQYWKKQLGTEIPLLVLPSDYIRPPVQTFNGDKVQFTIGKEIAEPLYLLGKKYDATLFMVLLAMVKILLHRYSGQTDIIIGTPIAGRSHPMLENQIGMFVNTLALRTKFESTDAFPTLLAKVKETALGAYSNPDYPFDQLVDELKLERDLSRNPLFDVMVILQNTEMAQDQIPMAQGLAVHKFPLPQVTSKFDMLFEFIEADGEIKGSIEFNTDVYSKDRMNRVVNHLHSLLSSVIDSPNTEIDQVEYIGADEKIQMDRWNDTYYPYPDEVCIHQLFERRVKETPDALAVISNKEKITYGKLNEQANVLAGRLQACGVGREALVAVCLERSIDMVIALLAVLKAGGAYLPIHPDLPYERIQYMLTDSGTKVLIGRDHTSQLTDDLGCQLVVMDSNAIMFSNERNERDTEYSPSVINEPSDLAYVIYTSGTTGKPKGVMIEHRSLMNRLNWMQRLYPLGAKDVILQKTTFMFDVSVWELFWWMLSGSALCLLKDGDEKNPHTIIQSIQRNNVTTLHFVPSMLDVFLDVLESSGKISQVAALTRVFCSGEALKPNQVERFNRIMHRSNETKLFNLYGPTEAAIDASYHACSTDDHIEIVPIGKPIDNMKLYIVDHNLNLQPIGVPGELCIAGIGVARGYLNNPVLTAEKFVPCPFAEGHDRSMNVERMYRTGDLAMWLSDGEIAYLGRLDNQVKIRGHRIELGEIENQLLRIHAIRKVVVTTKYVSGDLSLCAYIVADSPLNASAVKYELTRFLPDYMIPAFIVQLEEDIPCTTNGKVDLKALPDPVIKISEEDFRPHKGIEAKLAELWSEILHLNTKQIGRETSFFELGGNSLKIVMLGTRITEYFGQNIPIDVLFRYPTIRAFAQFMMPGETVDTLADEYIDESVNLLEAMVFQLGEDNLDE